MNGTSANMPATVHAINPGFSLWSKATKNRRNAPAYQGIAAKKNPNKNKNQPTPTPQNGRGGSRTGMPSTKTCCWTAPGEATNPWLPNPIGEAW